MQYENLCANQKAFWQVTGITETSAKY